MYCYSDERAEQERGIVERVATRFEAAMTQLREGLARPHATRPGLAAHRAMEDDAFLRRLALPDSGHRRRDRQHGRRRHLDPPSPGRLDGYASGAFLEF